ncbi:MAG TPA: pilus assembly protein PilM [Bacteroidota bacterium]|nr:pilus assembly protein PilM [Bacteroidota bacterium]
MKAIRSVGVSFLSGKIQLAELEQKRKATVLALGESESSVNFAEEGETISADSPKLRKFASELGALLKQHDVEARQIAFTLPPDPMFINILPIDSSVSKTELPEYLQWELNQYLPGVSVKDYILDSHGLPVEETHAQQTFMVAVRRGMVSFLHKVAVSLKMKLSLVDVDQFSTEKTLILNYPEILEFDIVLIGLRENGIDASVIHNGEMADYRAFQYNGEKNSMKPILQYLKYLKQKTNSTPAAVLLHGLDISKDLVVSLRQETGIKQTLPLNAFRKIKPSKYLPASLVKESHKFAAAIGLALRVK